LFQRVDARVGPPRPGYVHRPPFYSGDDLFKCSLNSGQTRLYLPAMKPAAIVGHRDLDAA